MFPRLAHNQLAHGRLTESVFVAQGGLADATLGVAGAYFTDLISGQFCTGATLAARGASFCGCVAHIVGLIAKKQMIGTYTRWIVATMANTHALWDGAICQLPCHSRGKKRPASSTRTHDATIAMCVFRGSPNPARASCVNFLPKPIGERAALRGCGRMRGHIETPSMCRAPGCSCSAGAFCALHYTRTRSLVQAV